MPTEKHRETDIEQYIVNREYIANVYVKKCFLITMLVYTACFLLNLVGVFVVEQSLMMCAYITSLVIYLIVMWVTTYMSLSSKWMKYIMLFSLVTVFTITGVFLTYHVVVISILPFLYASLYSSKKVMRYVYILTVVSTVIIVYGGYYWGLCDANMALLTSQRLQEYSVDGQFVLSRINANPPFSLLVYFVMPRCLIYIAFMFVCNSIFRIMDGSLKRAEISMQLEETREEILRDNRVKSDLLARISHQMEADLLGTVALTDEEKKQEQEMEFQADYIVPDAKILVVDDYEMNIEVLRALLKRTQIQVQAASCGQKCLELLEQEDYDVIFMDHMMPGMDGIETLKKIRQEALCDNTPVVLITNHTFAENAQKYLAEGFAGILSKPLIPDRLDELILNLIQDKVIKKKD